MKINVIYLSFISKFKPNKTLMKRIFNSLALLALFAVCFTSCKKDDQKSKTTSEKIVGVWHLVNTVYNEHHDNLDHKETDTYGPNDVFEFKKDGTVRASINGEEDTTTYTLVGDTKITIDGDATYDLKTLNANSLVFYTKEIDGADYSEITITFKR